MAVRHWLDSNGNWNTAADWTGGLVPGSTDDAIIDAAGNYTALEDASSTAPIDLPSIAASDAGAVLDIADVTGNQVGILGLADISRPLLGGSPSLTITGAFATSDLLHVDSGFADGGGLIVGGTVSNTGGVQAGAAGFVPDTVPTLTIGGLETFALFDPTGHPPAPALRGGARSLVNADSANFRASASGNGTSAATVGAAPDNSGAAPVASTSQVMNVAATATVAATTVPTLATLVSFNGTNGDFPLAGLIADAVGNLFGTTESGGANGDGNVFEVVKTGSGYASAPSTLITFNGSDGANLQAGLIADAAGDLFGTTYGGGANGDGTVFKIAKTASGYASAPTTLVSFNGSNGANPQAGLIADAAGDLFGTTRNGGVNGDGTVFKIFETGSGYASAPTP